MKVTDTIIIGFTLLAICLSACLDVVSLDAPKTEEPGPIIVEGIISQGVGPHLIRVSRSTPLGIRYNEAIELDEIWVENNHGLSENLVSYGEGVFALESKQIKGVVGDRYRLHFRTKDKQTYRSNWDKLMSGSQIDTVYFERVFEDRFTDEGYLVGKSFIDIYADIQLTSLPVSPYMRWEAERWWLINEYPRSSPPSKACYVKDPLLNNNRLQLFDGTGVKSTIWKGQLLGSAEVDFRFYEKTYINLFQYSLSSEAFTYWQKLEKVVKQNGDIFDTPPASVRGNVYNKSDPNELVLGYFGASMVDTFHFPIYRQDLGVKVDWLCRLADSRPVYSGHPCFECLVIPNSISQRPDYW